VPVRCAGCTGFGRQLEFVTALCETQGFHFKYINSVGDQESTFFLTREGASVPDDVALTLENPGDALIRGVPVYENTVSQNATSMSALAFFLSQTRASRFSLLLSLRPSPSHPCHPTFVVTCAGIRRPRSGLLPYM